MARDLSVGWCGMVRVAGENCGNLETLIMEVPKNGVSGAAWKS